MIANQAGYYQQEHSCGLAWPSCKRNSLTLGGGNQWQSIAKYLYDNTAMGSVGCFTKQLITDGICPSCHIVSWQTITP